MEITHLPQRQIDMLHILLCCSTLSGKKYAWNSSSGSQFLRVGGHAFFSSIMKNSVMGLGKVSLSDKEKIFSRISGLSMSFSFTLRSSYETYVFSVVRQT